MRGPRTWLVVAGILVASAYAVPGFAVADVASIRLTDTFRFEPGDVTVLVNTTVRWQNAGTTAWHTVTAYEDDLPEGDAYFDSSGAENETAARQAPPEGYLRPGDVFEVTFRVPGDYAYFCVPHEGAGMRGVVHVVESLPEPPPSGLALVLPIGLALAAALAVSASYLVLRHRRR